MPTKSTEYTKRWRQRHPEKARECHRQAQAKWRAKNREGVRAVKKAWYKRNPEKHALYARTRYYQSRYGLTIQEAKNLITTAGKCKICCGDKKLVIDHDHTTGNVRGVLCDACNKGIGLLGDTKETLQRALAYFL